MRLAAAGVHAHSVTRSTHNLTRGLACALTLQDNKALVASLNKVLVTYNARGDAHGALTNGNGAASTNGGGGGAVPASPGRAAPGTAVGMQSRARLEMELAHVRRQVADLVMTHVRGQLHRVHSHVAPHATNAPEAQWLSFAQPQALSRLPHLGARALPQRTDAATWKRERLELEAALTNARERVSHTRSLCGSQVDEARAAAAKALEERQALLQYAQHLEAEMETVRARGQARRER